MASGEAQGVMVLTVQTIRPPPTGGQAAMAAQRGNQVESDERYKRRVRLYAWAVPGMHRAGPGERGGGSYGRRAVAAAKGASMQISGEGKGLSVDSANFFSERAQCGCILEQIMYDTCTCTCNMLQVSM